MRMKTLLLIRHAKAEHGVGDLRDEDRGLTARGEADCMIMGEVLRRRGHVPDLVLTSPAERARRTAERLVRAAGAGRDCITESPGIYEGSVRTLLHCIHGVPDASTCVALVGHNPGMEELLRRLDPDSGEKFVTCGVVVIDVLSGDWADVAAATVSVREFLRPGEFGGGAH